MTTPNQKSECKHCFDENSWASKAHRCISCCFCHTKEEEKSFSDFFHKASTEEKEKVILEVVKEANEEQRINYERNYSHTHCWKQKPTPDCGQPLEKHKQCCLCDTPVPDKKDHDKNNCEDCQDVMTGFTPTVEHCDEKDCPECDLKAYNRGRAEERAKILEEMEKWLFDNGLTHKECFVKVRDFINFLIKEK